PVVVPVAGAHKPARPDPEPALERELPARHEAGVRLAGRAPERELPAGAERLPAAIDGPPGDHELSRGGRRDGERQARSGESKEVVSAHVIAPYLMIVRSWCATLSG